MKYFLRKHCFIGSVLFFSSSYAAHHGHVTIADPILGSRDIIYEQINEFAVVEGDILIGKVAHLKAQGAIITPKAGGSRWPNGVVPYEVAEDLPFMNKLAIYQAIDHWQKNTHLEFLELNSKNRYEHRDYISFIHAEGTTCSSYVGKKGGKQEINLAPRCTTMNTVHEIGHALGLWHEQSRADRNSYVRIVWENIDDKYKHNFEQQLTDGKDFGYYDYQSIMHYGSFAFSKNGEKTIIPLTDGVEIGQRTHLSEKDIAAVKAMYPEA
ncbi:metalloproteinase-like protein [Legionella moravica]|uniref:Astacin protease n=1 Tax=Legionella moravica TaxID=39962 RepID=A0A378JZZ0_9GAMM|nr:Dot/Icm T4SS effector Zinc-dependent metalloprotease LegP [Legionella moravica]KTD34484.1 metalloproteinase-like protein [Legionella moravica]STX64203.1 astacin protease [Legionella moravica]